jgi:hypothetical protein
MSSEQEVKYMKKKTVCICLCMILLIPLLSATATANQPPTTPHIEGPTSGKAGVPHEYAICSEDPDEDQITYSIYWDDGTGEEIIGPVPSGVCALASHTWSKQGEYTISARASDGQAESNWGQLEVTISKKHRAINTPFLSFLQNHLNMFPILQKILLFMR